MPRIIRAIKLIDTPFNFTLDQLQAVMVNNSDSVGTTDNWLRELEKIFGVPVTGIFDITAVDSDHG